MRNVKNEGEPGGGPFWVKGWDNDISLQIVESSQVDLDNKKQAKMLANATHLTCRFSMFNAQLQTRALRSY
jgi:hypothetical protein